MSEQKKGNVITHADITLLESKNRSFENDRDDALENLTEQFPDYPKNDTLATAVAIVTGSERSRRNSHYFRYRALFDVSDGEQLGIDPENVVESSLFDLDARIAQMTPGQLKMARLMGGKGISAELGHVDQLGNWNSGSLIDDEIRELPNSPALSDAGFVFADTYGDKSRAKTSYKIQLADEVSTDGVQSAHGAVLKGVRKRAAADVLTERGDAYDLIKLSTFVIHSAQLGREYLNAIDQVFTLSSNKETAHLAGPVADKVGEAIIEPFIEHPEFRSLSPGIVAVSSMYFALHRAK